MVTIWGVNSCTSSINNHDNYYTPPQTSQRMEFTCDKAGVTVGVLGVLAGAITVNPSVAAGGYSAGSSIGKYICENNKG